MHNILLFSVVLLILPFGSYGDYSMYCWCQQGPSSYQELVDNSESWSSWTNCYLDGNVESTNTCYNTVCPGGNWVLGNYYGPNEVFLTVASAADCISQCSAMGNGYNIANMHASCGVTSNDDNDDIYDYDDDDDNDSSGGVAGIISTIIIFAMLISCCVWFSRRRRDNTHEKLPNCCYKFFCPTCALLGYQGCESKSDVFMVCCFGNLFTLLCWEPKSVKVFIDEIPTVEAPPTVIEKVPINQTVQYSQPTKAEAYHV